MKDKNTFTADELPLESKIYFKKDNFSSSGFRQVYPYKDDEGKWLWKNVLYGGSVNLFWIIFFILLILGFVYVFNHDVAEFKKIVANPCDYCNCEDYLSPTDYSRSNRELKGGKNEK